jgi:hypothetical protein
LDIIELIIPIALLSFWEDIRRQSSRMPEKQSNHNFLTEIDSRISESYRPLQEWSFQDLFIFSGRDIWELLPIPIFPVVFPNVLSDWIQWR